MKEEEEIVNLEFLKRQSNNLLRWAAKLEKDTFVEKELKRSLRSTNIKEEDFDLILADLLYSGKMAVEEITINNDKFRLLKLGSLTTNEVPIISDKEKAIFVLESNINSIEDKI